jgi:hypothetical protein
MPIGTGRALAENLSVQVRVRGPVTWALGVVILVEHGNGHGKAVATA